MSQSIIEQSQEGHVYQNFQVVWAKILGWPWWPARIMEIPSEKDGNYKVQFFADTSHAFLPLQKLTPYAQGRDRFSTPKGHYRNFTKALVQADRLLQSTSSPKDQARTQYTFREKLPDQQNQIINQFQQVQANSKHDFQQKSQQEIPSEESMIAARLNRMLKQEHRRQQRNRLMMRKRQRQQKRQYVQELLKQYKLDEIVRQDQDNESLKILKKRKLISKKYSSQRSQENAACNQIRLTRIIYRALSTKQIPIKNRQSIAVELMRSFYSQQGKEVCGIHRALFQWIRCNDGETIKESYRSWPSETKIEHSTDCF